MNDRFDLAASPFLVLGLTPESSGTEVERQFQKISGLLRMEASAAMTYDTPWGPRKRDQEAVREAVAELRRPERRLLHELLYEGVTASREHRE
jgi:hypothetical protein